MQYLILCCFDESRWEAAPEAERTRVMSAYGEFVAAAKASGRYLAGAKLDHSGHAVTIRQGAGDADVTDGPFAETKEQLGGYHLVECRDLNEAISLAKRIPTIPFGGAVEVRAVASMI